MPNKRTENVVSAGAAAGLQQSHGQRLARVTRGPKLGSSSIIIRMSAIRKLTGEAVDNGLLAPELAAGISRVKSARSIGVRTGKRFLEHFADANNGANPDLMRVIRLNVVSTAEIKLSFR